MRLNIYRKELNDQKKSLIFWSLGILLFLVVGMSKHQGFSSNDGATLIDILNTLPAGISAVFGTDVIDLTSIMGFFSIMVLYLSVLLGVHAVLISTNIITKEETDKTAEFLFAKPISRRFILTSKLMAALTSMVILNIVTAICSVWIISIYNKGDSITSDILFVMPAILLIQLLFLMVGIAVATVSNRPKKAGMAAALVLLVTFIISALVDITDKLDYLKYVTPFKYFDAKVLLTEHSYDATYLTLTAIIIVILTAVSFISLKRKDLSI